MQRIIQWLFLLLIGGSSLPLQAELQYQTQLLALAGQQQAVRLPRGYQLELLTDQLDGPRMLSFSAQGELLIGARSGAVYRLKPPYTEPETLIELDNYPHSVVVRGDHILIAQTNGLYRALYRTGQPRIDPTRLQLMAKIPVGVSVGPDGALYFTSDSGINGLFKLSKIQ